MKKYRIVSHYILATLMVLSTSCQGSQLKTPSGINPIWIDEVGYLSKAATVILEDNARYVIYETNEKINGLTIIYAVSDGDPPLFGSHRRNEKKEALILFTISRTSLPTILWHEYRKPYPLTGLHCQVNNQEKVLCPLSQIPIKTFHSFAKAPSFIPLCRAKFFL